MIYYTQIIRIMAMVDGRIKGDKYEQDKAETWI